MKIVLTLISVAIIVFGLYFINSNTENTGGKEETIEFQSEDLGIKFNHSAKLIPQIRITEQLQQLGIVGQVFLNTQEILDSGNDEAILYHITIGEKSQNVSNEKLLDRIRREAQSPESLETVVYGENTYWKTKTKNIPYEIVLADDYTDVTYTRVIGPERFVRIYTAIGNEDSPELVKILESLKTY